MYEKASKQAKGDWPRTPCAVIGESLLMVIVPWTALALCGWDWSRGNFFIAGTLVGVGLGFAAIGSNRVLRRRVAVPLCAAMVCLGALLGAGLHSIRAANLMQRWDIAVAWGLLAGALHGSAFAGARLLGRKYRVERPADNDAEPTDQMG